MGSGQSRADVGSWPLQPQGGLGHLTAVSQCIQVIPDHTSALNGSSLSMSNLLGGAQNALTGKFDQQGVCHQHKMPFTS